ncbi:MAG: hypothetical protein KJS95_12305 [Gammaproteobacteria bacterium]|nr:hypothetical protein [Gammaproteobacteria bacterium]
MLDWFFAVALFIVGCPLGMGIGTFVSLLFSGWVKFGIFGAIIAMICLWFWIDTSLANLAGWGLGRLFGMGPRFREAMSRETRRANISSRNSLIAGIFAGLVAIAFLPTSVILGMLKAIRW